MVRDKTCPAAMQGPLAGDDPRCFAGYDEGQREGAASSSYDAAGGPYEGAPLPLDPAPASGLRPSPRIKKYYFDDMPVTDAVPCGPAVQAAVRRRPTTPLRPTTPATGGPDLPQADLSR